MTTPLPTTRRSLRKIALLLLPPFLLLLFLSILATQFAELGTAKELLSLTSFVILLSFSALAFNWCRVPTSFTPETLLIVIYQAGVDFFIASLLALVSTFFAWLQMSPLPQTKLLQILGFWLHWIFLFLSLGLFVFAALDLVRISKVIGNGRK
ncbi:MAG: hypothetical protein WCP60_08440 [bacterium]